MKKPEPADCWVGSFGWPFSVRPPCGGLEGPALPSSSSSPPPPRPLGCRSKGKFSKPGMRRSALASTREVTLIETTAGETRSKMSANDIGAPGGGAKIGAVEALIRCAPASAWAAGSHACAGDGGGHDTRAGDGAQEI